MLDTCDDTADAAGVSSLQPVAPQSVRSLSYDEFCAVRRNKETERQTHFRPKKRTQKSAVSIQVGRMHMVNGVLRRVRGEMCFVAADPASTAQEVLELADAKHRACNCFLLHAGAFVLLYPDGQRVRSIPGTCIPFTLAAYREFLRKSYQKITLFICEEDDLSAEEEDCELPLTDILVFWTGADTVPPCGFESSLNVAFFSQDASTGRLTQEPPSRRLPSSSTCSLTLSLPRDVGDPEVLWECCMMP